MSAMDPEAIRTTLEATGVVRIDGAFSRDRAAAMRRTVWSFVGQRDGAKADDPTTWPAGGQWVGGMKKIKRRPVFDILDNQPVRHALDAIFGAGEWTRPTNPGGQILFTYPGPGPWVLPDGWHMDCGFESPTWPVFAVKAFAFFDNVDPCGGGTMVLPGSHRVVERYRETIPPGTGGGMVNWKRFLRHDPWLASLLDGASMADHGRSLVGTSHEVDGVPVAVHELTGEPGDVVITHLHVFHSASPNTSSRPRQMIGKGVFRAGLRHAAGEGE
jgi:hypothetical protein